MAQRHFVFLLLYLNLYQKKKNFRWFSTNRFKTIAINTIINPIFFLFFFGRNWLTPPSNSNGSLDDVFSLLLPTCRLTPKYSDTRYCTRNLDPSRAFRVRIAAGPFYWSRVPVTARDDATTNSSPTDSIGHFSLVCRGPEKSFDLARGSLVPLARRTGPGRSELRRDSTRDRTQLCET